MSLPESVASPLTGAASPLIGKLGASKLIEAYRAQFGYDAAPCFKDAPEVGIYECSTGFRFYYPYSTAGPASLYECLQQFDWNYQEAKWEHDVALREIDAGQLVLDVGCGQAAFLHRAQTERGASVSGLEFNPKAAQKGLERGVDVSIETIAAHAARRPGHYDVVTSFQVLEHVTEPRQFLLDIAAATRPGGRVFIGVPNSGGFVGRDPQAVLNAPPHHMGLWNRQSLERVAELVGLRVERIEVEPLNNPDWFQATVEREYLPAGWKTKLYYRLGGAQVLKRAIADYAASIAGHTIMAIYRK